MSAARVNRVRHASEMGRPCCYYLEANADALRTAGVVIAALALPVKVRASIKPHVEERMGLSIVRYAFDISIPGREWRGSGSAQEAELLNPANWHDGQTG